MIIRRSLSQRKFKHQFKRVRNGAANTPSQILIVGIKIASLLYIYKCFHSMSAIADDDLLQRYCLPADVCGTLQTESMRRSARVRMTDVHPRCFVTVQFACIFQAFSFKSYVNQYCINRVF